MPLLPGLFGGRPRFQVAPARTPLVTSGLVHYFDPASLKLVDNAPVTSWTDRIGSVGTTQTTDSTAPHTFVADSGNGLPAVRLSGAAVLKTGGSDAIAGVTGGTDFTVIVMARNFQSLPAGQYNPVLASVGGGYSNWLMADKDMTGTNKAKMPCATPGIRMTGKLQSSALLSGVALVNGAQIMDDDLAEGGQMFIGGWQNVAGASCGRADILGILVYDRALTAAETRQIMRHFCDRGKQPYPGGTTTKHCSYCGDSLTFGFPINIQSGPAFLTALALNQPWGTFDILAKTACLWEHVEKQRAHLGDIAALTGLKHIVYASEYANSAGQGAVTIQTLARTWLKAAKAVPDTLTAFGTSTDYGDATFGVPNRRERAAYNAYWDNKANRAGLIDGYVALHADPHVGVIGCAPTDGRTSNAYFQSDGLHFKLLGYQAISAMMQPVIQALLAA